MAPHFNPNVVTRFAVQFSQGWQIGAYWMNPVTWSLYGLVVSNLEDKTENMGSGHGWQAYDCSRVSQELFWLQT